MNALRVDISVTVFVKYSISTETEKTGALFTSGKKKEYYPLTNRARGSYWEIKVVPVRTERRKRTDRSKVRTKIDRRPIFPVRLEQARLVGTLLYGTRPAKLVLILPAFENKKYTAHGKRSVWRNADQERTNQKHRISLKATLPYYKLLCINSYVYIFSDL